MIGYLKGKVVNIFDNVIILDVNGVGYELTATSKTISRLAVDNEGAVFTYLAVSEQGINFYGFNSLEEKSMFLKLISVSGIGPKMGVTIISDIELSELATAIAMNDVKTLSSVKGCGKKTAERIILELREKISATDVENKTSKKQETVTVSKEEEDAVIALMSLGFTRNESVTAVKKAIENGAKDLRSVITNAIRLAGKPL